MCDLLKQFFIDASGGLSVVFKCYGMLPMNLELCNLSKSMWGKRGKTQINSNVNFICIEI